MKECEVMEVLIDHIEAFHLTFHYTSQFTYNEIQIKIPQRPIYCLGEMKNSQNIQCVTIMKKIITKS